MKERYRKKQRIRHNKKDRKTLKKETHQPRKRHKGAIEKETEKSKECKAEAE